MTQATPNMANPTTDDDYLIIPIHVDMPAGAARIIAIILQEEINSWSEESDYEYQGLEEDVARVLRQSDRDIRNVMDYIITFVNHIRNTQPICLTVPRNGGQA